MSRRPPYYSLALISSATLAYEILLMRLLSIVQWHHFAYMIIALALLGYGISGTVISIFQNRLIIQFRQIYITAIFLFAFGSLCCFHIAQSIPLNVEEILWDFSHFGYLFLIFVVLSIPFLLAAAAICLTLMRYQEHTGALYAANLIGSGTGAILIILVLHVVFPRTALSCIALAGAMAGLIALIELNFKAKPVQIVATALLIIAIIGANQLTDINISPYKSLTQSLHIAGSKVINTKSSPMGLLTVVENRKVPFRYAPGLSLASDQEPLDQLGVFTDGNSPTSITRFPDFINQLRYLDQTSNALPYHLTKPEIVLIIGAGGGSEILLALYHNVPDIDAIEVNRQMVDLVNKDYGGFSGHLYSRENISTHINEARDFVSTTKKSFDLIQISLSDSLSSSSAGLHALNESHLYTVEALKLYLNTLSPNGYLAVTRWIKLPPRDALKLLVTATEALKASEQSQPSKQIALIRSWQTSTLLIKNGYLTETEKTAITLFCRERFFDIAYMPGIKEEQTNRYNALRQPYYYNAATALLGQNRESFLINYKFNISPAYDDRPYFNNFFKWSTFPEIVAVRKQGGMPLIESGYIVLIATLLISIAASIVLIMFPLFVVNKSGIVFRQTHDAIPLFIYFFCIGLSFIFIEMAFINRFILFLHHPIYSVSIMLTAFLVFAGIGSFYSGRINRHTNGKNDLFISVTAIAFITLIYQFVLGNLFDACITLPFALKMIIAAVLVAPLAFFMGMPFPIAMSSVVRRLNHMVPWVWGINGCASVISAVLATILAMHFGFSLLITVAVCLYIIAAFALPRTLFS